MTTAESAAKHLVCSVPIQCLSKPYCVPVALAPAACHDAYGSEVYAEAFQEHLQLSFLGGNMLYADRSVAGKRRIRKCT